MTFEDLRVFSTVAAERSFSRAARKLRRTQPAVSQAIRRLEQATGERLVDRSSRDGTLTDAGQLLLDYATRLLRLADEATGAVADLEDVKKGRVLIGANEGGVHAVLPLIEAFQRTHPDILVEVRRVAVAADGAGSAPPHAGLRRADVQARPTASWARILLGSDELVLLVSPSHPLAGARSDHDGGDGPSGGDRAQRPVAGARSRAAAVRTAPRAAEHPHVAAEPRRHQARGRDGPRRRAAAAPMRAGRDRARSARAGRRARAALACERCGSCLSRKAGGRAPRQRFWRPRKLQGR